MMYLNALGQPILVLHSLKAAFELLDRRANIYSDRAPLTVANEVLCGGLLTIFMRYGDVLVFPFSSSNQELIILPVVGVALAVQHMRYFPKQ